MQPMQETRVPSPGQEDPLEERMATHSRILGWNILWTEEPGGLQSMRSQSSAKPEHPRSRMGCLSGCRAWESERLFSAPEKMLAAGKGAPSRKGREGAGGQRASPWGPGSWHSAASRGNTRSRPRQRAAFPRSRPRGK